jgi:hypothetical protein
MGFNKRYLNENALRQVFKARGADGVVIYVTKADAVMCDDSFASDVVALIESDNKEGLIKLFTDEQS